jgi:hypothetical protein
MLFQSTQMVGPILVFLSDDLGIVHLERDILEVVGKAVSGKAFNVFEYECLWTQFSYSPDSLPEHISTVSKGFVPTTKRKRLAWWATRDQCNLVGKRSIVKSSHICGGDHRPSSQVGLVSGPVEFNRVSAISVDFYHSSVVKSCSSDSDPQPTGTSEKLN